VGLWAEKNDRDDSDNDDRDRDERKPGDPARDPSAIMLRSPMFSPSEEQGSAAPLPLFLRTHAGSDDDDDDEEEEEEEENRAVST
jgi:hypothetical protein